MKPTPGSGHYKPHHYLNFLGLTHNPFPVAPDNTHFYISQHNDAIIAKLTQAVFSRKGFMLLCGEIGLGKTTISRRIMEILEQHNVETCLVLQSFYQGNDLLREIIRDFGMSTEEIRNDLPFLMELLNTFLLKKNNQGVNCAILIDDAQNLTIESLELIRLISNLEADRQKLVQILLVGQPELMDKLNTHELRQLKSRVTINQAPIPLHSSEIGKYIQFKLNRAGDPGKIVVTEKTLKKLYQLTRGNIRQVNILMDQALQYACTEQTLTVTPRHIKKANQELAFKLTGRRYSPAAAWTILVLVLIIIGMISGGALFYYTDSRKQISEKNIPAKKIATEPGVVRQKIEFPKPDATNSNVEKPHPEPLPAVPPDHGRLEKTLPGTNVSNPAPEPAGIVTNKKTDLEKEKPPENQVAKTIARFLTSYGLEAYGPEFEQALNQQQLHGVQTRIFNLTGYHLIKLNQLPDNIREKYDVLSRMADDSGKNEYYLFWKPWLKIIKFYSGFTGEEISDLQTLLKNKGLYQGNIDGIVGQIIMESVKAFQRQHQLPVSGFPDPETIFLLTHTTE